MTGILALAGVLTGPTITASDLIVSGEGFTSTITTDPTTITSTPTAAAYSWVKLSGDDIEIGSPSAATTDFAGVGMGTGEERTAIFVCDVTINGAVYRGPEVTAVVARFT